MILLLCYSIRPQNDEPSHVLQLRHGPTSHERSSSSSAVASSLFCLSASNADAAQCTRPIHSSTNKSLRQEYIIGRSQWKLCAPAVFVWCIVQRVMCVLFKHVSAHVYTLLTLHIYQKKPNNNLRVSWCLHKSAAREAQLLCAVTTTTRFEHYSFLVVVRDDAACNSTRRVSWHNNNTIVYRTYICVKYRMQIEWIM